MRKEKVFGNLAVLKNLCGVVVVVGCDETAFGKESLDSVPPNTVPRCHDGPVNGPGIASGTIPLILIVHAPQLFIVLRRRHAGRLELARLGDVACVSSHSDQYKSTHGRPDSYQILHMLPSESCRHNVRAQRAVAGRRANQPTSNTEHCKRNKLTNSQQLGDRSAAARR
jgi:hypothetical protein